jgi:hypothetical protein
LAIIALKRIKVKRALIFCANEIYDDTGINYMADLNRIKQNILEMKIKYIYLMNTIILLGSNIKILDNFDKRLLATIKPLQKLFSVYLETINENKIKQKFKEGMPFLNACSLLQNLIDDIKAYPKKTISRIDSFLDKVHDVSYPFEQNLFVAFMKVIQDARNMNEIMGKKDVFGYRKLLSEAFDKKIEELMNHILYNPKLETKNKMEILRRYFPENDPFLKNLFQKLKHEIITTELLYAEPKLRGFEVLDAQIFDSKAFKNALQFILKSNPANVDTLRPMLIGQLKLVADKITFADIEDKENIIKIKDSELFKQLMRNVLTEHNSREFGKNPEDKITLMYVINTLKKQVPLFIKSIQDKKNQILKEVSQVQSRIPHNNNLQSDNINTELPLPATKSPLQIFLQKIRNYFSIDFGKKWQDFWKWVSPSSNSL